MYSILALTLIALLVSLAVTPLVRHLSQRVGIIDRPDGGRKMHARAVPRTGGAAILISYAAAYVVLLLLPLRAAGFVYAQSAVIGKLLPAVGIIFLTGLADDWLDLRPWQKLAAELAAAAWAWASGVRILSIGGIAADPWFSLPLTVAWLVLCSNAFNLIDGVDGVAAGAGLAATITTTAAGILHGDIALGLATAPLAGCLVGFLRYNFNPASIFLGDSGSLLIGFLLGCYGAIWSQKSAAMLGMAAPVLALGFPLLEVGLSILRRFVRNEPIFGGDRGHIHHRLLDRGLPPGRVALLLYVACGVAAALSLLQSMTRQPMGALAVFFFGVAAWAGVQYLGYAEFDAVKRFFRSAFRPMLSAHVHLELLERSLVSASTLEQCWTAIEEAGRALGYSQMTAQLGSGRFTTAAEAGHDGPFWQFRLNLGEGSWVNITQRQGRGERSILLVPFSEAVTDILPPKIAEIGRRQATPGVDSLAALAAALDAPSHSTGRNSSTTSVMSSDCGAPSVNAATAS